MTPLSAARRGRALLVLATVVLAGCGLTDDLRRVLAVQSALTAAHGGQFQVNLENDERLTVHLFNAGQAARSRADSSEYLESVARTAYRAYEQRDSLTAVTVGYLEVSSTAVSSIEIAYPGRTWTGAALRALADTTAGASATPSDAPASRDGRPR